MVLALCPVAAFAETPLQPYTVTCNFKYGTYQKGGDTKSETNPYQFTVPVGSKFGIGYIEDCAPYKFVGWKETGSGTVYAPDQGNILPESNLTFDALYEVDGSLAITVEGFEVGKTPNDCTYTFDSTIPDITFSEDDILDIAWQQFIFDGSDYSWEMAYSSTAFEADTRYMIYITMDNKGLTEAPAVTVNGNTPENCIIATRDGEPIQLQILCELGTPPEPEPTITLTVPYTTTVKQGGSVAPGETTFELEVIDSQGNELIYDGVEVTAAVTTNGKGTYEGAMTFTGSLEDLDDMLGEGAFVRQVDAGKANWTYDDTVWWLRLFDGAAYASTDDAAPGYTVLIYPTLYEETGDGGKVYRPDWSKDPLEQMSFTNTYTKSTTRPSENGTNTGTVSSPQTGDNSSLAVWFALLAVSAAGVMGAGVYSKRRRSSR